MVQELLAAMEVVAEIIRLGSSVARRGLGGLSLVNTADKAEASCREPRSSAPGLGSDNREKEAGRKVAGWRERQLVTL